MGNMDELVGRSLNRYDLIELIGEGGGGAVFQAHDSVLQRDVAVKVMRPEIAQRSNFQQRFLQEARTAARLDHPGIVKVHDFGQDDDLFYIVMEYIQGGNLRTMLQNLRTQNKWVVLTESVEIVRQVCDALDYVHSQGVVHRDIKPDNLMLKPEPGNGLPYRVVITDLGLAQIIEDEDRGREPFSMGTPGYMSPEQARGQEAGPPSEVYSLGILLYELAVGRLPFPARTISEAVRYHTEEPIPAPRSIRPDLPIALERVIVKALEKDPAQRFDNVRQLADALEEAMPTVTEAAYTPESIEDTVSLVTQYEAPDERGPAHREGFPRTVPPGGADGSPRQDYLQILLPDRTARVVQITADEMIIGRDPSSDVVIDHPKVSRQHARLQHDGRQYWISDLNSRNGTFLGNTRLVAGDPAVWTIDQAVQIGEIWLRLKRGPQPGVIQAAGDETQPAETVVGEQPAAGSQWVSIFMETVHLSVTPGGSAAARFIVLNRSPVMNQFRINVDGIPISWIDPPPVIQLPPGGQQEVRLNIQPPQSPNSRPGRYPITIRVSGQEDPSQQAEVKATLTVGVYTRFTSDLRPRRVSPDQSTQVTIQNQGNAQETFVVDLLDQAEELVFHPNQARLTLAEGEMGSAEFLAAPRQRRIIGGTRTSPFTARISTRGGEVRTHSGELDSAGIIPPVVIPLLLVLCLCFSALGAYGFLDLFGAPARAQQTAAAETQIAAATQAALAQANQATIQAATATAEFLFALTLTAMPLPETPTPTETATPLVIIVTPTSEPASPTPTESLTPIIIIVTTTPEPATPTPTQPTATPTPIGGSPLIEFASARDGNYEIYAMLSDGSQQTRVTNDPANDTSPALSPDGSRVVFVSDRDGRRQIYLMNADGSGQANISNSQSEDYSPAWSPDGARIAFTSDRDGNPEIYVMNIDGSGQTRLTDDPDDDDNPAWSPDGGRIVFDSGDDNTRSINIMNADGSNRAPLTAGETIDFDAVFSPDGDFIAFVSNRDGVFDIYLMNSDGSNVTRLTELPDPAVGPAWSRDGQWVTFNTSLPGRGNIYIVRIDGSELTNLTNNQVDDLDPTW